MGRRGWLILSGSVLGLCVVCCVLVFVAGVPALRSGIREGIEDAVATEVAQQIPAVGGQAEPGEHVITEESLEASLRGEFDSEGGSSEDSDWLVSITPAGIEIGVTSQGQDATYTGVPRAENGEFVIADPDTSNRFFEFLLDPDDFADSVASSVNQYLAANGLRLDDVILEDGQMTLVTSAR